MTDPVERSEQFLLATRREESTDEIEAAIAALDGDELTAQLDSDGARLAFWVNVYNATTQRALAAEPEQYENRRQFFNAPLVTVAGRELSLDEIEHQLLRRAYVRYVLGYVSVPDTLRDEFFRRHQLEERDPRIHFALNCGAQSCPPIAAYTRDEIDDQLDLATRGYLDQTVEFSPGEGGFSSVFGADRAVVPRVMLWFRADFGGKAGIVEFLRKYDQIPNDAEPQLSYHEWDWTLDPADFAESAAAD